MTSYYSIIDVEGEEIVYKIETTNSIYVGFLLYIKITRINYYIVENTFRWQVITT